MGEYSLGFDDDERFVAHEKFFVEDVRAWARSRFGIDPPPDRTAVYGVSAGGEFSLAMGLRYPEIYGTVFSASPGAGYKPPRVMPPSLPRVYLVAGSQEPFFLRELLRLADDRDGSCAEVDALTMRHITAVDRKIADLQALRGELMHRLDSCHGATIADCRNIEALSPSAT